MTERPILFSAPMVRALLAGTKTQTRRALKNQPDREPSVHRVCRDKAGTKPVVVAMWDGPKAHNANACVCPYGVHGDRLWVRETFSRTNPGGDTGVYFYRADDQFPESLGPHRAFHGDEVWTPSIHMPRAASRITLDVMNVRAERLHDITEDDAVAEGFEARAFPGPWWQGYMDLDGKLIHQQHLGETPPDWMIEPKRMSDTKHLDQSAIDGFRGIWWDINGAESWKANPWVWVVEFKPAKQLT